MTSKSNTSISALMTYLVFMLVVIYYDFQKSTPNGDLISYLRNQPLLLGLMMIVIAFTIIFYWKSFKKFAENHSIEYLTKFIGYILAAFLAYFVIIPYQITDFKDFIILLVIVGFVFLLFLFSQWLIEKKFEKTSKEIVNDFLGTLKKPLLVFIPPILVLTLYYWVLLEITFQTAIYSGTIGSTMILVLAILAKDKKKNRIIGSIIIPLIFVALTLQAYITQEFNFPTELFVLSIATVLLIMLIIVIGLFDKNRRKSIQDFLFD